ncbi:class I SAM-dependent methyltransferase [Uliginosibacterium sp. H3]|uniref:Class I SAM-dependent methyltransferase n=1 Tax=Uliginosibacterium silvisoli TaxID=3114758 RepID=A0ABU6KAM9_9RHOO|nr:class I SAM-dependent methyltransferase [Uliginosibacterium sp. H3]
MSTHSQAIQDQFGPQAQAYLASAVHAAGADLQRAREIVSAAIPPKVQALDVGCGAGHLSFALAPALSEVIAFDPSAAMLDAVKAGAAERGLQNIATQQGSAEALPFADASFCVAATRYSTHHWLQLEAALQEMRRVVRPGGHVLVIDVEGDPEPLVDTHFQTMELLRDRSHIRNRTPAEWRALLQGADLELLAYEQWPLRLEFASWVARLRTPEQNVAMIRRLQTEAPREVQEGLRIEADGSFTAHTGLYWARVPRQ